MTDLRIITVDVFDGLAQLEDESVQCVVTSPPYWGLRDYGIEGQIGLERTPDEYVEKMVAVFREVRRVLRGDGTLWLNMGDSYSSGGRTSYDPDRVSKTSGLANNSSGIGRNTPPWAKPKDLIGIPWRVAFALQADGWYLRSDIIWHKPNPMPESVTDRPTKAHEYVFLMTRNAKYFYDADAVRESITSQTQERIADPANQPSQTASRGPRHRGLHAQTKLPPLQGSHGTMGHDGHGMRMGEKWNNPNGRNARTVWTIPTQPYDGAHFAVFPTAIPERCIKAGSRPGDTVLDPFGGSGTTPMVARGLGRNAIVIEINPEYVRLIEKRCALPWERTTDADETQMRIWGE